MNHLPTPIFSGSLLATLLSASEPGSWDWQTAVPESQGMSGIKLGAVQDALARQKTRAFLVIRNDRIVCEWYAPEHGPDKPHGTASLAKALVGGVSTALALSDGRLDLDDPAAKFIPQWRGDPRKARITIRQLGSHASGLADAEADGLPHEQLTGWAGDFWKRLQPPRDPFTLARDATPLLVEPGRQWHYSNPGIALLSYAVTASIRDAPERDLRVLLRERVMRPIGVADAEWSIGYGTTFNVDGLPLIGSWGGGSYTARAAARVARLMLREGDWNGRRLISAAAVRATTRDAGTRGPNGIGWWSNNDGLFPKVPRDAFWGAGAGHQVALVIPSRQLIVIRNGEKLAVTGDYEEPYARDIFEPALAAFTNSSDLAATRVQPESASLLPPSPVISNLQWAPRETIRRQARGSDNWPLAWADDDALYTAYGDGNGFEPFVPEKLSLGFAKILGGPDDFLGQNLRAPSGEQKGDGPAGRKASGLLCVDGVLYLWTRNATNSQMAWSYDHGANWQWADWRFTESFGCPAFVNYGRNYSGARDGWIYLLSPDTKDAYTPAPRLVLARAPKDQLRKRAAYEFFAGCDAHGVPVWSSELRQRGPMFPSPQVSEDSAVSERQNPANLGALACYRPTMTYHAALRRYLLVMPVRSTASQDVTGKVDTRFAGGLAIYDAPEPWGPWTTVFYTENWDVGPGDTASFPAKWISADGKTLHLVFSGDDHFSVRRCTVEYQRQPGPKP